MSDPTTHTDGLAGLQARRAAAKKPPAKRVIPPSQNPTTLKPYTAPEAPTADPPASSPSIARATPPDQVEPSRPAPHKVGLYIDESHGDFFEAVRAAGHSQRPRVTLTSSAVVRLALDRLIADLGVDGVRDALLAKPIDPKAVGRRRR